MATTKIKSGIKRNTSFGSMSVSSTSSSNYSVKSSTPLEDIASKYVKLEHREHVLNRPGMYIGSIDIDQYDTWIIENNKMIKSNIQFPPGLLKIFDEILVNAIDHSVRLKQKKPEEVDHYVKNIKVNINKDSGIIEVWNDGSGIDIVKHPEHDLYIVEMLFGHMLTSTNYDDTTERIVGGYNGVGSKACNIFSTFFEVETVDAIRRLHYKQRFEQNMSVINPPIITKYTKKPFTCFRFLPDYAKFNGINQRMTEDVYKLMQKRVYDCCAVTDKDVTVYFNDNKLEYKTFEKYVDLYLGTKSDQLRAYEYVNDRWEIAASYNENGFEQVSFVNGICTIKGGKHVDYIISQITKKLLEIMQKKKKDIAIKPQSIKDNLIVFIKCNIVNPTFDSQNKENLTTPASKFGSKCEVSDKFVIQLAKSGIIERCIEISQLNDSKKLAKTDGKKKNIIRNIPQLEDANWAGTTKSKECCLILCEGQSAASMAVAGLTVVGRDKFGVFPLKGKILNVKDQTAQRISDNEEITNLKKILGLESGKEYSVDNIGNDLRYGKIILLVDADVDGSHIKGLLFNVFHSMWRSLVKCNVFLTSMLTPIVKVSKGNNIISFYNLTDYNNWVENNNIKGYTIKYYKGLGTSTAAEAKEYFSNLNIINYVYDEATTDNKIDLAFNKKKADERKLWLGSYNRQSILDYKERNIKIDDFIDKELIHFSNYDVERSIPNICDGLKTSQRKILFTCFKKNLLSHEIKVAQLAGSVSELTEYRHGEQSLQAAIVGLAQNFVGSNNINILEPKGQYGTRRCGGQDSASPRYIYTMIASIAQKIFLKSDNQILTYLKDDGLDIEPEYYVPIIPMILVNGCIGIGTGFSTNIPCFNPRDIVQVIKTILDGSDDILVEMIPFYRNFKGVIEKKDDKYISRGLFNKISPTKIEITELPIGFWTIDFKEMIEKFMDKNNEIKHYESHHTDKDVKFILHFINSDVCDSYLEVENNGLTKLENTFKLASSKFLGVTNMYLFNDKCQIQKYTSPLEIIYDFVDIRLRYYQKRKDYMTVKFEYDVELLRNKVRFIKEVIEDDIVISKLTKAQLEGLLSKRNYMLHEEKYDYIIRIPVYNLTIDRVIELEEELSNTLAELERIKNMDIKDMWRSELDEFMVAYEQFEIEDNHGANNSKKKYKV